VQACVETLAMLVAMAWADGHLDETERAGVLAAAASSTCPRSCATG